MGVQSSKVQAIEVVEAGQPGWPGTVEHPVTGDYPVTGDHVTGVRSGANSVSHSVANLGQSREPTAVRVVTPALATRENTKDRLERELAEKEDASNSGPTSPSGKKSKAETYFANERTFLAWLGMGTGLVGMAGLLYVMGTTEATLYSAVVFAVLSLFAVGYSIGQFYWRIYKIKRNDEKGFDDWIGPSYILTIMVMALTATICLQLTYGDERNTQGTGTSSRALTPSQTMSLQGLPLFHQYGGLTPDPMTSDTTWTCSDGLIAAINIQTGQVVSTLDIQGYTFSCRAVAAVGTKSLLTAVTKTMGRPYTLVFYDRKANVVINSLEMDFLEGTLTGFTFVPHVLQPIRSQTFLYNGTFLMGTQTSVTAVQLYVDSDDVTVHAHFFHVPLPAKFLDAGPLASDADNIYMVAHSSDPTEHADVLVYRIKDGALICTQSIKSTGLETGMVVTPISMTVYKITVMEKSAKELKMYKLDMEQCQV